MNAQRFMFLLALSIGMFTSSITPSVFTGNQNDIFGNPTPSTGTNSPNDNNPTTKTTTKTTRFKGFIDSFNLTDPSSPFVYNNANRPFTLATNGTNFYASMLSQSPNHITDQTVLYWWTINAANPTAFSDVANGNISEVVAGSELVAALNSTSPTLADVWIADGSYHYPHSLYSPIIDEPINITDVAVNNNDVYFATGKHFQHYTDGEGSEFIDYYPVVPGYVLAMSTSASNNGYVFTINSNTNSIDAWDSQTGVFISSVAAESPVTRLASSDGYVFAVSMNNSNIIQTFDFTTVTAPVQLDDIYAAGPIRQIVAASNGPRVFATNTFDVTMVQGWHISDGCCGTQIIDGFNPFNFETNISLITADSNRLTVYGQGNSQDVMKSYSVSSADEESTFDIPTHDITQLAVTHSDQAYVVYNNAPSVIQQFSACGGHAIEFAKPSCSCITKLVASYDVIAAVTDANKIFTYNPTGCQLAEICIDNDITDIVVNNDGEDSSCGALYVAVNNCITKYSKDGCLQWQYHGQLYERILMLSTSINNSYLFAVTAYDEIIAIDIFSGLRVGRFHGKAPIALMTSFDDGLVAFVYESCLHTIRIVDFSVPCAPTIKESIDAGDDVTNLISYSSESDQVYFTTQCNPGYVYGWQLADGCDCNQALTGFNPVNPDLGNINFLVSGCGSFFIAGCGFLQNYAFTGEGAANITFNTHDQVTYLASTACNQVFAAMISDQNKIYAWSSEGGSSSTFDDTACGPIAQLVANSDYVITRNFDLTKVDIWSSEGTKLGSISSQYIFDVAVNDRNTDEFSCECTGSVYITDGQHFDLYDTCGNFVASLPQVSGNVTHIASNDNYAYVFVTNDTNNLIETYTTQGVFAGNIATSGEAGTVSLLTCKESNVFEVNSTNPAEIEVFDFSTPATPVLSQTVTADGAIVQIAASADGTEIYATNATVAADIQGWTVGTGCDPEPTLITGYNPLTLTAGVNLLAADASVVAVFGETSLT